MIKLGVTSCFMYPDPNRLTFGHKTLSYLEHDMSRYLSRKGVMPILLPDLPWDELEQFLHEVDAFVFQGGVDIAPQTYRETPIENGRWPGDPHRDEYELKIMDWAFKNNKPILAICRGFQLANVYFGGTLYQDLKVQTQTAIEHRNAELYDRITHKIECTHNSLLADVYGLQEFTVNSVHHQGIKTLGKNLVVDARCLEDGTEDGSNDGPEEGLVEAFHYDDTTNHQDQRLVLAVQWHPEFSHTISDQVIDPKPLLDYFLKRIKR